VHEDAQHEHAGPTDDEAQQDHAEHSDETQPQLSAEPMHAENQTTPMGQPQEVHRHDRMQVTSKNKEHSPTSTDIRLHTEPPVDGKQTERTNVKTWKQRPTRTQEQSRGLHTQSQKAGPRKRASTVTHTKKEVDEVRTPAEPEGLSPTAAKPTDQLPLESRPEEEEGEEEQEEMTEQ
jgi:hypothetical protein